MAQTKQKTALQALAIGAKLLLICAIVAAVVAGVYHLTLSTYEANMQETKNKTIADIFPGVEGLTSKEMTAVKDVALSEVYDKNNVLIGYCAESVAAGFGGDISLMIGYAPDGSIVGVRVLAMSETPGLGSKAGEAQYLASYDGKTGILTLNQDVDAISGATISSRAILEGVNAATEALQEALKTKATLGGDTQ